MTQGGYLLFLNIIDNRYGKTQVALFVISILLFMTNLKFWMNLILGDKEAANKESLPLSQAEAKFLDHTYEQCNPIDKLKRIVDLYTKVDFFDMRNSSGR